MISRNLYSLKNKVPLSRNLFTLLTNADVKASNELCNEPILSYLKGSQERKEIAEALYKTATQCDDIPIVIGEEEIRTEDVHYQVMPHNFSQKLAKFYYADKDLIEKAICVAVESQQMWSKTKISERVKIWENAANLMSTKYRPQLNAATMLGQAKTIYQAEIDSAAELIDFFRFHAAFLQDTTKYEPISEDPTITKNSYHLRPLEGFVAAISPFNFTAIGGNLAFTPALCGNCVLWKPSDTAVLSNYLVFKIMREAGVPPGVVNFIPADGPTFGNTITCSPPLAGINFTGSTAVFKTLWSRVGANIDNYKNFPRLSGECGGKNFHFIHPSADIHTVTACTIRSAFEYSGQKCSACSRLYVPESLWPKIRANLIENMCKLQVGDVCDFSVFTSAVIDEKSYEKIKSYIDHVEDCENTEILVGGRCCKEVGYFVEPTLILSKNAFDELMTEEIFGPILTAYVYKDSEICETIEMVNCSKYALTGSVFATDEAFLNDVPDMFEMLAGNLYINDKCTGAVVGQQPFGGARNSGTNDKAGGPHYILRFLSPQTIKQSFTDLYEIEYPYMGK